MFLEPEAATVFVMDIKSLHKLSFEESQGCLSTGNLETPAEQQTYCLEPIHFNALERKKCEILCTAIIHKLLKGKSSGSRIWVRWGGGNHISPLPIFADSGLHSNMIRMSKRNQGPGPAIKVLWLFVAIYMHSHCF